MIFFTSDLHLGHETASAFATGPFPVSRRWTKPSSKLEPQGHREGYRLYPRRPDLPQPKAAGGISAAAAGERNISSLGIMTGDGSGVVRRNSSLKVSITCCMSQTGSGSTRSATTP